MVQIKIKKVKKTFKRNPQNLVKYKIKVQMKIFHQLVKKNFDFLNIDCEGNDLKILKTIDLKKFTPKIINIEVSKDNEKEIYGYLNFYGYNIYKYWVLPCAYWL